MIRTARIKNYEQSLQNGVQAVNEALVKANEEYKGYLGSMGFASVNARAGVVLKHIAYLEDVLEWNELVEEKGGAVARAQALENDRNAPKPYIMRW